ncbi:MAG: hypothetical protein WC269_00230 [Candidatus Gracilibacteria bacterium]|jgi:hypothetical protein
MADQTIKNTAEKIETAPLEGLKHESSERQDSQEIKETKEKFASSVDAHLEEAEQAEFVEGKVSEEAGETRDQKGDSATTGSSKTYDPAKIKAELLKNLPNAEIMKEQIKVEIEKEIKYLHSKAMKMMRSSDVSYFEMSNIMKKIRELKGVLLALAKTSMESLKHLWLRFVHGIM